MKFGIIGGLILLILTIVFSTIAIDNNKIAKEIVTTNFKLNKAEKEVDAKKATMPKIHEQKEELKTIMPEETNSTTSDKEIIKNQEKSKWQEFDKKFENFDEKFKDF